MKTIMVMAVSVQGRKGFIGLRREIDLPCIPVAGMEVTDFAWKESVTIQSVTLELGDDPRIYVHLGVEKAANEEAAAAVIETYKFFGWREMCASESLQPI